MNKLYIKKPVMLTVPKKQLYLVLSFMAKMINWKVKIVFETSNRLKIKTLFSFKDIVPEPLGSFQVYNFMCASCSGSYTGKTFRHMKFKVSEHQRMSPRKGKHLKGTLSTFVRNPMLACKHSVAWGDLGPPPV